MAQNRLKEGRVVLVEQHSAVAEHETGVLEKEHLVVDPHPVRRGVVLHLLTGFEVVLPRRLGGLETDPVATAEPGQGLVGQHRTAVEQLLMDADQVPFAGREQSQDLLLMGLCLFWTQELGDRRAAHSQHTVHRIPGNPNGTGDGANRMPLLAEHQDGAPD